MADPIKFHELLLNVNTFVESVRTLAALYEKPDLAQAEIDRLKTAVRATRDAAKYLNDLDFDPLRDELGNYDADNEFTIDKLRKSFNEKVFKAKEAGKQPLLTNVMDGGAPPPVPAPPVGGSAAATDASGATTPALGALAAGGGGPVKAGDAGDGRQGGPGKDEDIKLHEFFENVSRSLIDAQSELNRRSLDYASALDPRFPPAYYGIPSVRAELRLGFKSVTERGINLILINRKSVKDEYAESTVSFEVVGAPPPPGPTAFGDYVVPLPDFLVTGERRDRLVQSIFDKLKLGERYRNTIDRAVVMRYRQGPEERLRKFFVVWPGWSKSVKRPTLHHQWEELRLFYVEVGGDDQPTFPTGGDEDANPASPPSWDDPKYRFPPPDRVSIFEYPTADAGVAGGVLVVPDFKKLTNANPAAGPVETKETLAKRVVNLGDALVNVFLIFNYWLEAVKYQPPASSPPRA